MRMHRQCSLARASSIRSSAHSRADRAPKERFQFAFTTTPPLPTKFSKVKVSFFDEMKSPHVESNIVDIEIPTVESRKVTRGRIKHCLLGLLAFWRTFVIVLTPIVLLPLAFGSKEMRCAYVVLVMATYWTTEALPLSVTAFLPVFMYPLLGVLESKATCMAYMPPILFLLIGGLTVALAIEETNVHTRLALRVLLLVGTDPKWIMFAFMTTSAFLSMWISNTATTGMMVPIALAICEELLRSKHEVEDGNVDSSLEPSRKSSVQQPNFYTVPENFIRLPKIDQKITKGILLSICYSASIGGTGTLTGTAPNLIALSQLEQRTNNTDTGVNFPTWMAFQVPFLLVLLLIAWLWLVFIFLGFRQCRHICAAKNERVATVLRRKYDKLGSMRFGEWLVVGLLVLLVALWMFRDPKFIDGWQADYAKGFIKDSVPAMIVATLCFILPREAPDFSYFKSDRSKPRLRQSLVTWHAMQHKFPWNVVFIMGGGLSMALGVSQSGLSKLIGDYLSTTFATTSPALLCAIIVTAVTFLTEVSSNSSTSIIFVPIMIELGRSLNLNPLYFVLSTTIACSFAFMLPVATPPNAIVFGAELLKVPDMMMAGFGLNLLAIGVNLINFHTWSWWFFDLGTMPDWAKKIS